MHASSAIPVHDWPTLYDRHSRQLHHYIMVLNYPRLPWAGAAQRRTTAARIAPAPSPPNSTSTSPWRRTAGETAGPDRWRIRCQRRRTRTALQHAQRVCTHPARLFGTSSGPSELADAGKVVTSSHAGDHRSVNGIVRVERPPLPWVPGLNRSCSRPGWARWAQTGRSAVYRVHVPGCMGGTVLGHAALHLRLPITASV